MSLTREETILAARAARDYPAGVPEGAWFSDDGDRDDADSYAQELDRRMAERERLEYG